MVLERTSKEFKILKKYLKLKDMKLIKAKKRENNYFAEVLVEEPTSSTIIIYIAREKIEKFKEELENER